jgi:hypothetical protein
MKSTWKECSELHAQAERQLNALKKRCCRASKAVPSNVFVGRRRQPSLALLTFF